MHYLVEHSSRVRPDLEFASARENFYAAARLGLEAPLRWPGRGEVNVRELILTELVLKARVGLEELDIAAKDIQTYLDVIRERISSGQNGADWQRRWVRRHGPDMKHLTLSYFTNQEGGKPVHEWPL